MNQPKLNIRWKNLEKNFEVEEYFISRCAKLFEFQFVNQEEIVKAEVVYYDKSNNYKASLTVGIKGKPDVRAESELNHNLQHTINEAVEKSLDQLRRIKTQHYKH